MRSQRLPPEERLGLIHHSPNRATEALREAFGFIGVVGGLTAGLIAYGDARSPWLAVFVFLIVTYLLGRAVPDLMTEPHRGRHALYFAAWPSVATVALMGAYGAWGEMWFAVVVGLVVGLAVARLLGRTLLRDPRVRGSLDAAERSAPSRGHRDQRSDQPRPRFV